MRRIAAVHISLGLVLGLLGGATGCGPGMAGTGPGTVAPNPDDNRRELDPEGSDPGENITTYKRQLSELRQKRTAKAAAVDPSFPVCEDLCELMASICQVKAKLCTLADDHPGEDSYQGLCREAQHECREAQDSCVSCTEDTAQEQPAVR